MTGVATRLALTTEQVEEAHQALVQRQARLRLDLVRAGSAGQYLALQRAIEANAAVARQLAGALGIGGAPATEDLGDHHVFPGASR